MSPGVKGSCTCSAPALTGGTESRATPPAGPRPLFPECAPSRCARISVRMWPRLSGCGCVLAASGLSQSPRAASVRGRGVRACPRGGSAQASGARLVEPSVRSRARGARRAGSGGRSVEEAGWALRGRMQARKFVAALEVRAVAVAPEGAPRGRRAGGERVCPPPPLPHFRLPPLPRSRLRGPVRPGGNRAAQPHPGRRGSLPRPRRRLAGADRLSQPGSRRGR